MSAIMPKAAKKAARERGQIAGEDKSVASLLEFADEKCCARGIGC